MVLGDENLLFYVNLAGEVFYIVVHRMKSQSIRTDLQKRVFDDLILVICNPQMLQDLLNGTIKLIPNYSLTELKMMLSQIVHSSIMNINDYSMEKLFELTLIATKYQYTVCQNPKHIIFIALNHLDAMKRYLSDPLAIQAVKNLHFLLVKSYSEQIFGSEEDEEAVDGIKKENRMENYQKAIVEYLQDVNLKMTNLIKLGLQKMNGEFVIDASLKVNSGLVVKPAMLELYGVRGIQLGCSIYEMEIDPRRLAIVSANDNGNGNINKPSGNTQQLVTTINPSGKVKKRNVVGSSLSDKLEPKINTTAEEDDQIEGLKAIHGLDLCGTLLGCKLDDSKGNNSSNRSAINGFNYGSEETTATATGSITDNNISNSNKLMGEFNNIVRFDASSQNMAKIAKEFDLDLFDDNDSIGSTEVGTSSTAQLLEIAMNSHETKKKN